MMDIFQSKGIQLLLPARLEKPSYEFVSFVCCTEENIAGVLQSELSVGKCNQEGGFISFLYNGVKIEVHIVKHDEIQFALHYLAFGAAGTIPGKLLHQMGMKLSVRGLFYLVREQMFDGDSKSGHIMEEVPLTCEWEKALFLLGLSAENWTRISTQDQLFSFITASKEFCPTVFVEILESKLESFPIKSADLDIFLSFCMWVKDQTFEKKGFKARRVYRKGLYTIFPTLKNRMFANSGKMLRKKEISKKLNPEVVRQWLALDDTDSDVYQVLKLFRARHDELDILAMSNNEVRAGVVTYYQYHQQQSQI
jgi:hypothetical protein